MTWLWTVWWCSVSLRVWVVCCFVLDCLTVGIWGLWVVVIWLVGLVVFVIDGCYLWWFEL